ncbi:hypothetical protein [Arthrobacter sp. EpRS71]|uniref:hypothetical protein n=1 Tax=Arthrobacter sp. EpRS71 TaxID=1743141 RepID=UPI0007485B92|nr:hypothetical protein [Arthrobacter sp. EpRS71]KUM35812.1 hypothetical protein AR689_17705 [Arthrobacter sp. EpRS71]
MTEHLEPASFSPSETSPVAEPHATAPSAVAEELLRVIQAVEGVTAVYPAQPLWQSIAGAAIAAVTGESLPLVAVSGDADPLAVKVRIGVGTVLPAPKVARKVAEAVRNHLLPRPAAVEVYVVKVQPVS